MANGSRLSDSGGLKSLYIQFFTNLRNSFFLITKLNKKKIQNAVIDEKVQIKSILLNSVFSKTDIGRCVKI